MVQCRPEGHVDSKLLDVTSPAGFQGICCMVPRQGNVSCHTLRSSYGFGVPLLFTICSWFLSKLFYTCSRVSSAAIVLVWLQAAS